eukprot:137613-Hanusia_phi.AAC.6
MEMKQGKQKCSQTLTYGVETSWAHPLCDIVFYDMIDGFGDASFDFKKSLETGRHQVCEICEDTQGACVKCSIPECTSTFHVGCALKSGSQCLGLSANNARVKRTILCHKHISDQIQGDFIYAKCHICNAKNKSSNPTESLKKCENRAGKCWKSFHPSCKLPFLVRTEGGRLDAVVPL